MSATSNTTSSKIRRALTPQSPTPYLILAALVLGLSCMAKYRTVRKDQAGALDNSPSSSTNAVPTTSPELPMAPSAGIEVVYQGQIVNKVPTGVTFTIRPTIETRDPDNAEKDNCRNPGIVRADYNIAGIEKNTTRPNGSDCGNLGVTHEFSTAGTYVITLQVESDEAEKADASMTLIVYQPNDTTSMGGITVTADPMVTPLGSSISFQAVCDDNQNVTIVWRFGDNSTGLGVSKRHTYKTAGSYLVNADCQKGSSTISGSVTVVVLNPPPGAETGGDGSGSTDGTKEGNGSATDGSATDGSTTAGTSDGTIDGQGNSYDGSGNDDDDDSNGSGNDGGGADSPEGLGDGLGDGPGQNPGQNPGQHPKN